MTVTLEPDRITKGGLHVPGKDRMEFRPPERKSLLGLDVLAIAKRGSKGDGVFKVPQERNLSSLSSLDEDEMSASSGVDDIQTNTSQSRRSYSSRHYREASSNSKETLYSGVWLFSLWWGCFGIAFVCCRGKIQPWVTCS